MLILRSRSEFSIINALARNQAGMNRSIERLATGSKINRASDDPSGLIAADNIHKALKLLNSDLGTLERVDLIASTADGALSEVVSLLTQAEGIQLESTNNAGLSEEEKKANDESINSIVEAVNKIFKDTSFNDQKLFDGSLRLETPGGKKLSIGALDLQLWGQTPEDRLDEIKNYRKQISTLRGDAGAFSRIAVRSEKRNIQVSVENLTSAESLIRDADFAKETANLVRFQTLMKASIMSLKFMRSHAADVLALLTNTLK